LWFYIENNLRIEITAGLRAPVFLRRQTIAGACARPIAGAMFQTTTPAMSDPAAIVSLAREIATEAHEGQFRRDGVTPYITHPAAVASRVAGDAVAEAAAWLHDVIEDTSVTAGELAARGIPAEVIEIVCLLTLSGDTGYESYLAAIAAHPVAKRVKIADMLTNLSDRPTDRQIVKYAKGLLVLMG
jgi:(p)ppGpp synthase/HD superfamily hydrolase